MIPRSVHALIDYIYALVLIGAPYVVGLSGFGAEHLVLWGVGFGVILYSLLTNYSLGLVPLIPFRGHLMLDAAAGVFLIAAPWIFGFAERSWAPYVVFGLFDLAAVMLSRRTDDTLPEMLRSSDPA